MDRHVTRGDEAKLDLIAANIQNDYFEICADDDFLTDRDPMERVLAAGKDPESTTIADIMTVSPTSIAEPESIARALQLMREHSFRRLPVQDEFGRVCGVVYLDDILASFAEQYQGIAQLLKSESPRGIAEATTSRWEQPKEHHVAKS